MKALQETYEAKAGWLWLRRNKAAFVDHSPPRRPRLLVDVSVILRNDAGTGIQRVVRSVWSQLHSLYSKEFDVVPVYAARTRGYCFAPIDFLTKCERLGIVPVGVKKGDCFLGLDLAARYLPKWATQVQAWRVNGAKVHVVVYDLLPWSRPDWFAAATGERFTAWLYSLIKHADQLLCISEEVARELRSLLSQVSVNQRPQIGRLYLSGDLAGSVPSFGLSPAVTRTLERARKTPTLLMVGTVEPRKAYDRAISAFDLLWDSSADAPSLLIIGRPGWKTTALQDRIRQHPEFGRRLQWLQEASDEALNQAYTAAMAVLVASHAEGFGLPLAESAIHGRWALVRDIPVFREQQFPNVHYFSDDSASALAKSIEKITSLAKQMHPPQAVMPSWAWCVEQLIGEIGLREHPWATSRRRMITAS